MYIPSPEKQQDTHFEGPKFQKQQGTHFGVFEGPKLQNDGLLLLRLLD